MFAAMAEDAVISVYFLIYTRTPVTGLFESWLLWIHVSWTCEITSRRPIFRYRRSARQRNITQIGNTLTVVENGTVHCSATATSRWVQLTIFTKFTRAASFEAPLFEHKGKTIIQLSKLLLLLLYWTTVNCIYVCVVCVNICL